MNPEFFFGGEIAPGRDLKGKMYMHTYLSHIYIYIFMPGTCLEPSILVVEPSKTRSFPIKTRVIWVPGIYILCILCSCSRWQMERDIIIIYITIYVCIYVFCFVCTIYSCMCLLGSL